MFWRFTVSGRGNPSRSKLKVESPTAWRALGVATPHVNPISTPEKREQRAPLQRGSELTMTRPPPYVFCKLHLRDLALHKSFVCNTYEETHKLHLKDLHCTEIVPILARSRRARARAGISYNFTQMPLYQRSMRPSRGISLECGGDCRCRREIGRASCREKCRSRWSPYH